jgi:DNA-binding CsgD family transcriptional regulator
MIPARRTPTASPSEPAARPTLLAVCPRCGGRQRRPVAPGLSPREIEIAAEVAQGRSNKEIARALGISTHTVSTHLRRAFRKLGVATRTAFVVAALAETTSGPELPEKAGNPPLTPRSVPA